MTLAEELAKLEQATAQKRAELEREYAIRDLLGAVADGYRPPSIHFHRLYGSRGSIHFQPETYSSLRKADEKQPDAELLRALLASFPPLPCVKVSDSSTSFRPDFGESYSTEQRPVEEYECYGVTVRVETLQDIRAQIEWYTRLADGEVWSLRFTVPWYQTDFGQLDMIANRYAGHGPVSSWERCELQPKHDAQRICWASGAPEYPNSFTLYWDRDSGARLDFPAIAFAKVRV